jgi:hypothetical protein
LFSDKNFLMICGIARPLHAREITLGISESCIENLNTRTNLIQHVSKDNQPFIAASTLGHLIYKFPVCFGDM